MQLGKYELLEELGKGAFGVVYKAQDTLLGVIRALKVLHPEFVRDSIFLERFKQEARLAAQLEHPHLVPVYDLGTADGHFYLAMKFMPGGSLKDLLAEKGKLPKEEALELFSQICSGVAYAHEHGIIHRDLKPGNILVDTDGSLRVSDLGFAKAVSGNAGLSLTTSGGMVGTPSYMAPEIWRGKPALPASDQYSLACILYEMLTGKVLFEGNSPADVVTKHIVDGPQFSPEMPPELTDLLGKALAKDPAERFESLETFLASLDQKAEKIAPIPDLPANETPPADEPTPVEPRVPEPVAVDAAPTQGEVEQRKLPRWAKGVFVVLALILTVFLVLQFLPDSAWCALTADMLPGCAQNVTVEEPESQVPDPTLSQPEVAAPVNTAIPIATDRPSPTAALPTSTIKPVEMVAVFAGPFQMGCDPEHNGGSGCEGGDFSPIRNVYLDDFAIDKYEVTNAQYERCVNAGYCDTPWATYSRTRELYFGNDAYADYPVIYVSWQDAANYCSWAGKRLPTEAEWEKAARGTSVRAYPWGDQDPNCSLTNGNNCIGDTSAVGSYPSGASLYGALDMAGNVWEWVQDWYDENYYLESPYENPKGPDNGELKVMRGGGWWDSWIGQLTSIRGRYSISKPGTEDYYIFDSLGFRCASSAN